jgi:hypothetical protein
MHAAGGGIELATLVAQPAASNCIWAELVVGELGLPACWLPL